MGSVRGEGDDAYGAEADLVSSALEFLDVIEERAMGKQLAFFLDYDGTLTPIVENPSDAVRLPRRFPCPCLH